MTAKVSQGLYVGRFRRAAFAFGLQGTLRECVRSNIYIQVQNQKGPTNLPTKSPAPPSLKSACGDVAPDLLLALLLPTACLEDEDVGDRNGPESLAVLPTAIA